MVHEGLFPLGKQHTEVLLRQARILGQRVGCGTSAHTESSNGKVISSRRKAEEEP